MKIHKECKRVKENLNGKYESVKVYLYQFAKSSPGFSRNTAVEKQIFSLVHQTLSTPIKNKRSKIGNTYS